MTWNGNKDYLDRYEITYSGSSPADYQCTINGFKLSFLQMEGLDTKNLTVDIPKTITNGKNEYKVTAINNNAFDGAGSGIFQKGIVVDLNLHNATNLISIGSYAFQACPLTNFDGFIPDNVKTIGMFAFYACYDIKKISFPKELSVIEYAVFVSVEGIEEIVIPDSVIDIRGNAFQNSETKKPLIIPDSVQTIDKYIFDGWHNTSTVYLPKNNNTNYSPGTFSGSDLFPGGLTQCNLVAKDKADYDYFTTTPSHPLYQFGPNGTIDSRGFNHKNQLTYLDTNTNYNVKLHTLDNPSGATQEVAQGGLAVKPATPNTDTMIFDNWYTAETGGEVFNFAKPINGNVEVWARYKQREFTVASDGNGLKITGFNTTWLAENYTTTEQKLNVPINIPATINDKKVVGIANDAFSQTKYVGYTVKTLSFDTALEKLNIGTNAFYNCTELSGQVVLPKGVTVGAFAFGATKLSAIFLPNNALPNQSTYNENCFEGLHSDTLLICDNKADYSLFQDDTVLRAYRGRLTYQINVKFDLSKGHLINGENPTVPDEFKLFNKSYNYVKTDDVWALKADYKFPTAPIENYHTENLTYYQNYDSANNVFEDLINVDSNVALIDSDGFATIYAKYKPNEYKLVFDKNDTAAGGSAKDITVPFGEETFFPDHGFVKTGYAIVGWYANAAGTGDMYDYAKGIVVNYNNKTQLVKNIGGVDTITLYAKWDKIGYTIHFNKDFADATGAMTYMTMKTGETKKLMRVNFKRTGYLFGGWAITEGGDVYYGDEEEVCNLAGETPPEGAKVNLYATWTAISYYYTLDKNDNFASGSAPSPKKVFYDETTSLGKCPFVKNQYFCKGWSTNKDGIGGKFFAEGFDGVLNLRLQNGGLGSPQILYAQWASIFDFDATTGFINGFTAEFLKSVNDDPTQMNRINIKIPSTIDVGTRTVDVVGIGESAFDTSRGIYNGFTFVSLDLSQANKLKTISLKAFNSCKDLKGLLAIPKGVTTIGTNAFNGCQGLTNVILPTGVVTWGDDIFNSCTGLVNFELPSDMKEIPNGMFAECTSLGGTNGLVTIPEQVTSIGERAFAGCTNIKGIAMGKEVKNFGAQAFERCTNLTGHIDLPDGATVGKYAFDGTKFKYISLPKFVAGNINADAFSGILIVEGNKTLLICDDKANKDLYFASGSGGLNSNIVNNLTYEFTLKFDVHGLPPIDGQVKLYGQSYQYVKDASDVWSIDANYKFPIPKGGNLATDNSNFVGWYGSDVFGSDSDKIKEGDIINVNEQSYTLYSKIKLVITYNLGGGEGIKNTEVLYNGKVTKPSDPIRYGYKFIGWYADPTFGTVFDFENTTIDGNTTIYAKWEALKYIITFSANGGEGTHADITKTYGQPIDLPMSQFFTKYGYSISGWKPDLADRTDIYKDRLIVDIPSNKDELKDDGTSVFNLIAQWNINKYSISFEVGANGVHIPPINGIDHGSAVTPPTSATRPGYIFVGWYGENGLPFVFSKIESTQVAYARYDVTKFVVDFNPNGGSGAMDGIEVTYDEQQNLAGNKFKKPGFVFAGWNTKEDGTGESFEDLGAVKNLSENGAKVTLFAMWKHEKVNVAFVTDDDVITQVPTEYGSKIKAMESPVKDGFIFGGWYVDKECTVLFDFENTVVTEALTLYAKWDKDGLSVGAIVGIAVGSILGAGGIAAGIAVPLIIKKKKGGGGKATKTA